MKWVIAVLSLVVVSTPVHAAKPKRAAAQAAATKWAKALVKADPAKPASFADVAKLTSAGVRIAVFDGTDSTAVCDVTATDAAKVTEALTCARKATITTPLKPYSAKTLKNLWGWMKLNKSEIVKLTKTHEVFVFYESGEDIAQIAIVAVTLDADNVARVAVVFASELTS